MKTFKVSDITAQDAYKMIIGTVLPRPIAFVSTVSADGHLNLAPYSFFNVVCANPLIVSIATMRKGPEALKKDTLINIETTKQCVINVVDESYAMQVNMASTELSADESEWGFTGLEQVASTQVTPPRLASSPIQMECELERIIELSDQVMGGSLILLKVVAIHVKDELYDDGRIDTNAWNPIGRGAGQDFIRCLDRFALERPQVGYSTRV
jgi:flavin reductase (DIM6/NTAB) family NADH-FMN oxidoreductase RutF